MKKKLAPTAEEMINYELTKILHKLKWLAPNSRGLQAAYYGKFSELKRNCQIIINSIDRMENKDG